MIFRLNFNAQNDGLIHDQRKMSKQWINRYVIYVGEKKNNMIIILLIQLIERSPMIEWLRWFARFTSIVCVWLVNFLNKIANKTNVNNW